MMLSMVILLFGVAAAARHLDDRLPALMRAAFRSAFPSPSKIQPAGIASAQPI
jgi:hypothetical protein